MEWLKRFLPQKRFLKLINHSISIPSATVTQISLSPYQIVFYVVAEHPSFFINPPAANIPKDP